MNSEHPLLAEIRQGENKTLGKKGVRLVFGVKGGLDVQVIGNIVDDLLNSLHNQS